MMTNTKPRFETCVPLIKLATRRLILEGHYKLAYDYDTLASVYGFQYFEAHY